MNGIQRHGDVTIERGITGDYCIPVLRIPVEAVGTVYNFNKNQTVGILGFTVYRYSRDEFNRADYFTYFGRATDVDSSAILQKIVKFNGSSTIRVYSRLKDNYLYVYIRPQHQYDVHTVQVTFSPKIGFVEFLDTEDSKELYSDIQSSLLPASMETVTVTSNSSNNISIDPTFIAVNKVEYPHHVFLNFCYVTQYNSALSNNTVIGTVSPKPSRSMIFPVAFWGVTNTQEVGTCLCKISSSNGEISIIGLDHQITRKDVKLVIHTDYYTSYTS